jgi:integrase
MSSRNPNRVPVTSRGRRISGLYERTWSDGTSVFEFVGRLNGRVRTVKLDATTKSEAIAETESLRSGVREKRIDFAAERRVRVNEAAERYILHVKDLAGTDAEKAPATISDIELKLRLYVIPRIGHMKVVDVEAEHIRDLALSAKKKSRSTVHAIVSVTSGFFRYAVKERIANTNPVARARELYGGELLPKASEKTQRALTDDEIGRAMEHVSEAFSALLTVLAESGIRVGEALGLSWLCVDLERETIAIVGQLGSNGDVRETKTKRKRLIPISARAASALREHRVSMLEQGQNVDTGLVFVTRNGKPQSKRNALRAWTTALDKIGVDANLHSLRHSFISAHAERDTPVVLVADLVGHSRVTTTQTHYTRVRGGERQRLESLRSVL